MKGLRRSEEKKGNGESIRRKLSERPKRRKKKEKEVEDKVESVKGPTALAKLAGVSEEPDPAIRCGDWITKISLSIADISDSAGGWWKDVRTRAERAYARYLVSDPMARLDVKVTVDSFERKYDRVRSRVATLLLESLPESIANELISIRQTSPEEVLFRVLTLYQPGGLQERTVLLKQLESLEPFKNPQDGVVQIRGWERRRLRAQELKATLPDISIQVRCITEAMSKVVEQNSGLGFRLSLARAQLNLDVVPTEEALEKYIKLCTAEMLSASAVVVEEKEKTTPRAKRMDGSVSAAGGKGSPSSVASGANSSVSKGSKGGGAKGEEKPCKFWGTANGCKNGKNCTYPHPRAAATECWICGATEHKKDECPNPKVRSEETKEKTTASNQEWRGPHWQKGDGGKKGKSGSKGERRKRLERPTKTD